MNTHLDSVRLPVESASLGLLRLIETAPQRTQRELAQQLGVSLGKTNYLLRALLAKGLVKIGNFRRNDNKRAYAYLLTPQGAIAKAELTRAFLARKLEEYEQLRRDIESLQREVGARPT